MTVRLHEGISKSKTIDGKKYKLHDIYIHEYHAKTVAEGLRRKYNSARVITFSDNRYAVYYC